jgi:prohibitin 2
MTERTRRRFAERGLVIAVGALLVIGFLSLLLWRAIFIPILPGHVGVLYSLLFNGTVVERVFLEGLAVKWPWNRMYIFDVRTQAMPIEVKALSAEGMSTTVNVVALYRARQKSAPRLLKEIGLDYPEKVVGPLVMRSIRETVGGFDSTELFSVDRVQLQDQILSVIRQSQQAELIDFQNVLIQTIVLPKIVSDAIAKKLAQEQLAQAYVYRLQAQRLEADRLKIEATGLRDFYAIVGASLTDRLLTWRGIEATVNLAKSPNTKVVIVGGGKDQLPLILGSDIHNIPTTEGSTDAAAGAETTPDSSEATPSGPPATSPEPSLPRLSKPLMPSNAPLFDPENNTSDLDSIGQPATSPLAPRGSGD